MGDPIFPSRGGLEHPPCGTTSALAKGDPVSLQMVVGLGLTIGGIAPALTVAVVVNQRTEPVSRASLVVRGTRAARRDFIEAPVPEHRLDVISDTATDEEDANNCEPPDRGRHQENGELCSRREPVIVPRDHLPGDLPVAPNDSADRAARPRAMGLQARPRLTASDRRIV